MNRQAAATFLAGIYANLAQIAALRLFMGTFYGTELHLGVFLAVWLGGVAAGGAFGGAISPSSRKVLAGMAVGPLLSLGGLWAMLPFFPVLTGSFLPFFPVFLFKCTMLLPLAIPVGALIPALMNDERKRLGALFACESLGGFVGGVIFSLLLGGRASALLLILVLPVLPLAGLTLTAVNRVSAGFLVCAFSLVIGFAGPGAGNALQKNLWERFHPGISHSLTVETPYQKVQVAAYEGQSNVYLDGVFAGSWPDPIRAEEKVHAFVSAIASPSRILVLGAPSPDIIGEFNKYSGLVLTIVEIDQVLMKILAGSSASNASVQWVCQDPRAFLRNLSPAQTFDGILVLSADPTTLLANRLFTREAFSDMRNHLSDPGILSVSVAGAENYLGTQMEQVVLSMHRTLADVFPEIFAVPGDPIVFLAAIRPGTILTDPETLAERFSERRLKKVSFQGVSFSNLLLPFRVLELKEWLKRPVAAPLNEDAFPTAFARQIRLWDIFSGSKLSSILEKLEWLTLPRACGLAFGLALGCGAVMFFLTPSRGKTLLFSGTAGITGITGILVELILILLYQNRHGAMFQMAALFFGLFMLGLAAGAYPHDGVYTPKKPWMAYVFRGYPHDGVYTPENPWMAYLFGGSRSSRGEEASPRTLRNLKLSQIGLAALLAGAIDRSSLHEAWVIGLGIFLFAFLQGWEFVVLDRRLRALDLKANVTAGLLFWTDNLGALAGALAAGPWLLPVMGMKGTLNLLGLLLLLNLVFLKVFDNPSPPD